MPGKNRNRLCSLLLAAALLIPAPAGAAYATLRPGATGQEVEQMQDALNAVLDKMAGDADLKKLFDDGTAMEIAGKYALTEQVVLTEGV